MCGRFTLTTDLKELAERFSVPLPPNAHYNPRYNIAPTQQVIVIGDGADSIRTLEPVQTKIVSNNLV